MNEAVTLTFAASVPFLLLGLVLLLARLEDTLTDGLEPSAPATSGPAAAVAAAEPAQPTPAVSTVVEVGPAGVAAA